MFSLEIYRLVKSGNLPLRLTCSKFRVIEAKKKYIKGLNRKTSEDQYVMSTYSLKYTVEKIGDQAKKLKKKCYNHARE